MMSSRIEGLASRRLKICAPPDRPAPHADGRRGDSAARRRGFRSSRREVSARVTRGNARHLAVTLWLNRGLPSAGPKSDSLFSKLSLLFVYLCRSDAWRASICAAHHILISGFFASYCIRWPMGMQG